MMHPFLKKILVTIHLHLVGIRAILRENTFDRPRNLNLSDLRTASGKTVVITGGSRGIGLEAIKKFLSLGCRVIVGCRRPVDVENCIRAKVEDDDGEISDRLACLPLDLTLMASVRKFASAVLASEPRVDCLVNNAGVMFGERATTEDGFERQMATNHLGHFLLTSLLLKKLASTASVHNCFTTVLNVSSVAHFVGSWMDFEDLNSESFYSPEAAYCSSKAAQVMCTKLLNRTLRQEGCDNVFVNCIHPGVVNTDLYNSNLMGKLIRLLTFWAMKTPEQGSRCVVHAAVSSSVHGGGFYLDNLRPARSSSFVNDHDNQAKVWKATCDLLGIDEFFFR